MSERLSLAQVGFLCTYALGMAGGQILFKTAALRLAGEAPLGERMLGLLHNWAFLAAVALYAALALLWVWVLSFTPLSRAYPFIALAFAVTPLLGGFWFGEPISLRLMIGIAVVLCGLLLVTG